MPRIRIDNIDLEVADGTTVLEAARQIGVPIPTLCYRAGHSPLTSCLVCLVKINGGAKLVPSCATKVADGMVIESETPEVHEARRTALLDRMREQGGLSRQHFIDQAARHGVTITIDEFVPFMAGWGRAGDPLAEYEVIWLWRVNMPEVNEIQFRAGISAAGERLGWWWTGILEAILEDLKPAHTVLNFAYVT